MGDSFDKTPTHREPRRDKPQTLSGIEATKALNIPAGGVDSDTVEASTAARLARNRVRVRASAEEREHSCDGVVSTGVGSGSSAGSANDEFSGNDATPRRESLNYEENSPSGQSFGKALFGRTMRHPSSGGPTTRKCVLTLDGYSYVIVASTPENLPSKRDDPTGTCSNSGSAATNSPGATVERRAAAGDTTANERTKVTSPPGSSIEAGGGEQSSEGGETYGHSTASGSTTINGQVARHGSLTIVRRSNSRKNFTQIDAQQTILASPSGTKLQQSAIFGESVSIAATPTTAASTALTTRIFSYDNQNREANSSPKLTASEAAPHTEYSPASAQTPPQSATAQQHSYTLRMQPSSPNTGNFPGTNNSSNPELPTPNTAEDQCGSASSMGEGNGACGSAANVSSLGSVDLATENLPSVDTPDACDKAAGRLRSLLRLLNSGEVSAEVLQKNLHYAARVLEAVFIDESKSPTASRTNLGRKSSSCVDGEDPAEGGAQRCNSDCKNLNCNQHSHQSHSCTKTQDNNNSNSNCSLQGGESRTQSQEQEQQQQHSASHNQTSIDSRTKGVSLAPQTHSGPTGPPSTTEGRAPSDSAAASHGESAGSSSSSSNKATIQRQRRLRTPVWARSISTNKTY